MKAAAHFAEQGFYVSKALDPQCPFDFVAVKDKDNIELIDSKCASYRKNGTLINRVLKPYQKKLEVKLAVRKFKK